MLLILINRLIRRLRSIGMSTYLDSLFDPAITMIIALSYGATIILGGLYVTHGVITIGNLVSFVTYLGMMVWPMFAVGMFFDTMERGNASYDRVMELLNQQSAIIDAKRGIEQRPHGDIQYQIKQFNHPNDAGTSLSNVNFTLKAGQTLGIVGRVGAGKSTIMKLILRAFDEYEGHITYGGHNISSMRLIVTYQPLVMCPKIVFCSQIRFAKIFVLPIRL